MLEIHNNELTLERIQNSNLNYINAQQIQKENFQQLIKLKLKLLKMAQL